MSFGTITRSRPNTRMAPAQQGADLSDRYHPCRPDLASPVTQVQSKYTSRPRRAQCMAVLASLSTEGHTSIISCTAVVCCRKQSNEMTLCKALEAVHHALMCTHYHLQPIVLQDKFNPVSSFKSLPAVRPVEPTPHKQQWHQAMSTSSVTATVRGSHQFHNNVSDKRHKAATSNHGNTESMLCTMYCPASSVSLERAADGWSAGSNIGLAPCEVQTLQKSLTRSGPKVTRPGPRGEGCTPSTPSLVVGSDHRRSMSTTPPSSMLSGLVNSSICATRLMLRPMPVPM